MKNKVIFLGLLLIITASTGFSQVKFGLKGGVNLSRLKGDKEFTTPNPTQETNYKISVPNMTMVGFHVGLVSQIQLFNFFLQPEALYTVTRNDINVYDLNSADPDEANEVTQRMNRIDVPIIAGLKFNALKLGLGPLVTFLISNDSDLEKITSYDLKLKRATVGFQAMVGFDIKKFSIDLKYEGSLSKMSDGINIGNNEKMTFDSRINQFILSAGLFF
jgi:hypothetical protein